MPSPPLPPENQLAERLNLARDIARAAGHLTLGYFQRDDLLVERKADDSPVTAADRGAEQLMRRRIGETFPQDAILGEESGEAPGTSGFTWILDPIDGTKSFICGVPLYSVLVGVVWERRSVIGVIFIPGLNEGIYAAAGHGAWWHRGDSPPQRARVSPLPVLRGGLFITSQVDSFAARGADDVYRQLQQSAAITRTWGDGYGYLLVATGRALAMVDAAMHVWDAAAVQPVLVEAGGTFTDWRGESTIYGGEGVGTNGLVLEEVLAITRIYPPAIRP